jgi:2'-5' RNA ligase
VDEALRARIGEQLESLRRLAPHARWVRPDRLHLTLAFLGEIAEAAVPPLVDALGRVASRRRALELSVRGGGVFGSLQRPKVLWLALSGALDELASLHSDLRGELTALGHLPDYPTFEPHLTLARSKDPRGDPHLARCADRLGNAELGVLSVRRLVLFSSQAQRDGMEHVALAQHELS